MLLQPEPISARIARHFVKAVLLESGRLGWIEAAELAVTEIVANAVLHAHTPLRVTTRLFGDELRVEVRDNNPALPLQRSYDLHASTGRGMEMVAAVTTAHGTRALGADGKVVWFSISDTSSSAQLLDLWSGPDERLVEVVLLGLPVVLGQAARQHHDALVRELSLHLAGHPDPRVGQGDLAAADRARALGSQAFSAAVADGDPPDGVDSASASAALDVTLAVRPDDIGFAALQKVLTVAEELAGDGRLLVRPGLPEIVALRYWACEQVIHQLQGAAPTAWNGADDDRVTRLRAAQPFPEPVDGAVAAVRGSTRLVLPPTDPGAWRR